MTTLSPPHLVLSATPRRAPQVTQVEFDGRAVLYLSPARSLYRLDEIGTVLWGCFDGNVRLAELADDLVYLYPDEDRTVIERDLLAFVERLVGGGLLELPDHEERPPGGDATRPPG